MESLVTFTDEEVLEDLQPSHWVWIMLSQSAEPTPRECSCSRTNRACGREAFSLAYGKGWLNAQTTTQMVSQHTTTAQGVEPKQEDTTH